MRKLIVLSFITLDGVVQADGSPEEDPSGGFTYGGWSTPYFDDFLGETMHEQLSRPFDVVLGRKTYEASAYPRTAGAHSPCSSESREPAAPTLHQKGSLGYTGNAMPKMPSEKC
jgi:hypothetical protein